MANLIGIEIDNNEIRMAQIQGKTIKTVCESIPDNLISNGKIILPDILSRHIKEVANKGGFSGKGVAFILPEETTYFRNLVMPAVSDRQLKLNLPYEFRDFMTDAVVNYNYDYAVDYIEEGETEDQTSLHIYAAAAEKTVVNNYAEVFRKAGLSLKVAIPREMATINLISEVPEASNSEVCIIDINYDHTRINIISGGRLVASKTTDIGCRQIDGAISVAKEIDSYLASTYRQTNYENVLLSQECEVVYEQISLEILKAINFYRYENPDSKLEFISFSGSGANIKELTNNISKSVNLEETAADSWFPGYKITNETSQCLLTLGATM